MIVAFALTFDPATAQLGGEGAKTYGFVPHAAFFSVETKPANLIDPHVFVPDGAAVAATGPQGINHVTGFRPAFGVDAPSTPAANAQGRALGFTLAQWFGAHGTVSLTSVGGNTRASLTFSGLVKGGRYSLFENHFSDAGVSFTPLDGTASTNTFSASSDGTATLQVTIPGNVTHSEAVLLVFHSDGRDHGTQRGQLGVDAHHQLMVQCPLTPRSISCSVTALRLARRPHNRALAVAYINGCCAPMEELLASQE